MTAAMVSQQQFKIDVLEIFTAKQFATFQAEYDHLFERRWLSRLALGGQRGQQRQQ